MLDWIRANETLLWWSFAASVLIVVVTLAAVPLMLALIPEDYFLPAKGRPARQPRHPGLRAALLIVKNAVGGLFVLLGLAMLVLPGQGLLSILTGLILLDFPGKRAIERRIIRRPGVLRAANAIRSWAGRPPLKIDHRSRPRASSPQS